MICLHDNIRKIRHSLDLKQKFVAKKLGMSVSNYSNYENGHYIITEFFLEKVATIFNCNVDFIKNYSESSIFELSEKKQAINLELQQVLLVVSQSVKANNLLLEKIVSKIG